MLSVRSAAVRVAARSTTSTPLLREGARGAAVLRLQGRLERAGFSPGRADGDFGPKTRGAVERFQRARGLEVDGVVGPKTWAALEKGAVAAPKPQPAPPGRYAYRARGTAYFPSNDPIEGGFNDRMGKPLHTLQAYLAGKAPYVSVAMDPKAFPYGTSIRIPELEKKYGRPIDFRVVDTGGAFFGRGTSRIDVCVANRTASYDATINGPLTIVSAKRAGA